MFDRIIVGGWEMLQRHRRKAIASGTAMLLLAIVLYYWQQEPNYEFAFQTIDDPSQMSRVVALANDLRTVRTWQPFYFQDPNTAATPTDDAPRSKPKPREESTRCIELLADWIQGCELPPDPDYPADNTAFRLPEGCDARDALARASQEPTFQLINGMVKHLPPLTASDLRSWRKTSRERLIRELVSHFSEVRQQERDQAYLKVMTVPANARLLTELASPEFPTAAAWHRRMAKVVYFNSQSTREHWVDQFIHAVDEHIRPIVKRREAVFANQQVVFGKDGQSKIVFKTVTTENGPAITLNERDLTSHMKVLVRHRVGDGDREWDTGIRLRTVHWTLTADAPHRFYPEKPEHFQPVWPTDPSETSLDLDVLRATLAELGYPKSVELRDCELTLEGSANRPEFRFRFTARHPLFAEFQQKHDIRFRVADAKEFNEQIAQLIKQTRSGLRTAVLNATKWNGWPATFTAIPDAPNDFRAKFDIHAIGMPLEIDARLTREGQIAFAPLPSTELQQRLTTTLYGTNSATAIPPLLEEVHIGNQSPYLTLNWIQYPSTGESVKTRHRLLLDSMGKLRWEREPLEGLITNASVKPITLPTGQPLQVPEADCLQQIQQMLKSQFGHFPQPPTAAVFTTTAGTWLTLGLPLYDYPELTLGPVLLMENQSPVQAANQLLSAGNLRKESRSQWEARRDWTHPRYGRVRAELTQFDPSAGTVTVRCCHRRFETEDADSWNDTFSIVNGQWNRPLVTPAFQKVLQTGLINTAKQAFARLPAVTRLAKFGLILNIEPDLDSLRPGESFSLSPPLMPFKATVNLPLVGFQVDLQGIRYDEDGIHCPDTARFSYIGSFYFPQMCLSDPVIQLDFRSERPGMAIAGKVTPPVIGVRGVPNTKRAVAPLASQLERAGIADGIPEIRTDNLWLHVAYLHAEFSGNLDRAEAQLELQAQARIRMMNKVDVAEGRIQVRPGQPWFGGDVEAIARVPGFDYIPARLAGNIEIDGRNGRFRASAGADVFGQNLLQMRLNLNAYPKDNSSDVYTLIGQMKLPGNVASLKLDGKASGDFKKYNLIGQTTIGPVQIEARIDQTHGIRWFRSVNLNGRLFAWATSEAIFGCTELDTMQTDIDRIQQQQSFFSNQYQITSASPREEGILQTRFNSSSDAWPKFKLKQEEDKGGVDGDGRGPAGYVQYTGVTCLPDPNSTSILHFWTLKQSAVERRLEELLDREIARIDISNIRHHHNPSAFTSYNIMQRTTGPNPGHTIITLQDGQLGTMYLWHGQNGSGTFENITDQYPADILKNEFTTTTPTLAGWYPLAQGLYNHAFDYYFAKHGAGDGFASDIPTKLNRQGACFHYTAKGQLYPKEHSHYRYYWPCNLKLSVHESVLKCRVDIVQPFVPATRINDGLLAQIQALFNEPFLARESAKNPAELIALSTDANPKMGWLNVINRGAGRFEFWIRENKTTTKIPISIATNQGAFPEPNHRESQAMIYRGVNLLARAIFAGKKITGKAFVGPQGVLVESENGDWWIIRDLGGDNAGECYFLERGRFNQWAAESRRLLAPIWDTSDKRQSLTSHAIAEDLLAPYARRGDRGFEANPFGMVIGLAEK